MNACVPTSLTESDLTAFKRLGIGPELLAQARVERVGDQQARNDYGIRFSPVSDLSGIVFPYLSSVTGQRVTARLRRDHPELDLEGKPLQKYLCPFGDGRHLYILPGAKELLADSACPVVIVEAEKSVLALTALAGRSGHKLVAIGTGGCWGWRGQIGIETDSTGQRVQVKGALPDFDLIRWAGRDVVICFDANAASNPMVRQARRALAEELEARGARVRVAELPVLEAVNGPDDLIATCGDQTMLALLESARATEAVAETEAEAAIAAIEAAPNAARRNGNLPAYQALAAISDPERRESLVNRAAKALKIRKEIVENKIQTERRNAEQARSQAQRQAREARLRTLPLDLGALVGELERFFAERAHLPLHSPLILALFTLNTWTFDACDTTPYLSLESPVPQCGKTTVLNLLEAVVHEPRQATATSEAALFRIIEARNPTLLIDEAETLMGRGERAESIRAIANVGYKRGATVPRCVGEGAETQVHDFHVYCPKVFASIGGLRDALLDRCIVVSMSKRPPNVRLKSARHTAVRRAAEPLRERLEAYQIQERDSLVLLHESAPDEGYWLELSDREAEIFEPLLAQARRAGPEIEKRALEAAFALSRRKQEIQAEDQEYSLARELLEALEEHGQDKFAPGDLVPHLSEAEVWGARLSEKSEDKAKAVQVGYFIRKLRLHSRERTRRGTRYATNEAIEKLRAIVPEKPATSATPATESEKSTTYGVADRPGTLPPSLKAPATSGNGVAGAGSLIAGAESVPATPKARVNGGAVASVAGVAGLSGDAEPYWGEV